MLGGISIRLNEFIMAKRFTWYAPLPRDHIGLPNTYMDFLQDSDEMVHTGHASCVITTAPTPWFLGQGATE